MHHIFRFLTIGAVGVALSACAGMELTSAQRMSPAGSEFDKALYGEYIALAQEEYNEADYKDSDVFALRAKAAANAQSPAPEAADARVQPAKAASGIVWARDYLVSALAQGAAEQQPALAARAQAMYECWAQEQEENFQPDDIEKCRQGFLSAMTDLKPKAKPAPAAPKPAPAALPAAFTVFFDFNSAELSDSAKAAIKQAGDAIKGVKFGHIVVTGHADRSGSDAYNAALSAKRAEAVANAIAIAGDVHMDRVVVEAKGESAPRVATPDGQREPANRRATVELMN